VSSNEIAMNIISVKKTAGQDNYQLKENDKTVLDIRYKPEMHIARVETDNERRVLIIEDEGLLKIKLAIKNEYGVRIGSLSYDNFSDTHGSVEIENTNFRFIVKNSPVSELNIYKGSRRNIIYSCQFTADDNRSKIERSTYSSAIISLSWYLFSKGAVKNKSMFNEAIIF
jgi:hypothetical protein